MTDLEKRIRDLAALWRERSAQMQSSADELAADWPSAIGVKLHRASAETYAAGALELEAVLAGRPARTYSTTET